MSDDNKAEAPEDQGTQPEAEEPKQGDGLNITQTQLDEIVKKAKAQSARSERAKFRKEAEAQRGSTQNNANDPPSNGDASDVTDRVKALEEQLTRERGDRQFSDALLLIPNAKLNAARRRALRGVFDPENPEALVDEYSALAGDDALGEPSPTAPTTPAGPTAPQPTPFNPGAPASSPREVSDNPLTWSRSDYDRVRARGGREALNKVEAWRSTLPGGAPSMFRRKIPKG